MLDHQIRDLNRSNYNLDRFLTELTLSKTVKQSKIHCFDLFILEKTGKSWMILSTHYPIPAPNLPRETEVTLKMCMSR
jgi:hypothetical protein